VFGVGDDEQSIYSSRRSPRRFAFHLENSATRLRVRAGADGRDVRREHDGRRSGMS
jgi:hypothetical protein